MSVVAVACALLVAACAGGFTNPASGVSDTTATLEGAVFSPTDATISYWFQYGLTTAYGSETPHRSLAIADRDNHPVSEGLSSLTPGTAYHYRVCAQQAQAGPVCAAPRTFTTTGTAPLSITANPVLFPTFDPAVSDYVTRCGVDPVSVSVSAPPGTTVAINGGTARSGTFSQGVALSPGKAFDVVTHESTSTSTFHVRCLPADFPAWTYSQARQPSANFYITTPLQVKAPNGQQAGDYVAIYNDHGVPVWWQKSPGAVDAKLLSDGTLAWGHFLLIRPPGTGYDIHRLDGSLVRTWNSIGSDTDFHDFEMLPNGNALIGSYVPRPGTLDLSAYGGPSTNATLTDAVIQEVTPAGAVVWSWNSKDHFGPSDMPARWQPSTFGFPGQLQDGRSTVDYVHWNSVQEVGNTVVMSFRHLDAVYGINKTDGSILFKLGGTTTPESLTVIGDPESNPLGGQHFARILPDGTLTVFDNNTLETSAPRGVRYRLDLINRTATFVEAVSDPAVTTSPCCGSTSKLSDGSWVTSWGGNPVISEFGPGGDRHFTIGFTSINTTFGFSYRVDPVVGPSPSIENLRAGMNAMS